MNPLALALILGATLGRAEDPSAFEVGLAVKASMLTSATLVIFFLVSSEVDLVVVLDLVVVPGDEEP